MILVNYPKSFDFIGYEDILGYQYRFQDSHVTIRTALSVNVDGNELHGSYASPDPYTVTDISCEAPDLKFTVSQPGTSDYASVYIRYDMEDKDKAMKAIPFSFDVKVGEETVHVSSEVSLPRITYFSGRLRALGNELLKYRNMYDSYWLFQQLGGTPVNSDKDNASSPFYQQEFKTIGTRCFRLNFNPMTTSGEGVLYPFSGNTLNKVTFRYEPAVPTVHIYPTEYLTTSAGKRVLINRGAPIHYYSPSGGTLNYDKAAPWVSISERDGVYSADCDENTGAARTAYIDFTVDDTVTEQVQVIQMGAAGQESFLNVTPETVTVSSEASVQVFNITKSDYVREVTCSTDDFWLMPHMYNETMRVRIAPSSAKRTRTGKVTVRGWDDGNKVYVTKTVTITQTPPRVPRIVPVWMDYITEFDGDEYVKYTVTINGEAVYHGRAYRMPDMDKIRLNVNRIAENYLTSDAKLGKDYTRLQENDDATAVVTVYTEDGQSDTWGVIYDWSYADYDGNLQRPVRKEIDSRMYSPASRLDEFLVVTDWESDTYTKKSLCGCRYGAYYLNSKGGWDAFAFQGKGGRKDSIERSTIEKAVYNTELRHRVNDYDISVDSVWSLYTGCLDDGECRRLNDLVTSPKVYLHDLEDDVIIPVNVKTASYEFKRTDWSGKRKLYQIEFRRASALYRR